MFRGASDRASLAAVPAGLLAVLCLSACGSGAQSLGSAKIERSIQESILKERGLRTTVSCPAGIPPDAGRSFTCEAHLDVGAYPLTVTEVDSSGKVRYQDPRPLIVLNIARVERAIEASISSQRHVSARASCPGEVLQRAGIAFRCTAVIDGTTRLYPFAVSELDSSGHVRYAGT